MLFVYGPKKLVRMLSNHWNEDLPKGRVGYLNNYVVVASGYSSLHGCSTANIVKKKGSKVYGIVYRVSKDLLDALAGFSKNYTLVKKNVTVGEGQRITALAFINKSDVLYKQAPKKDYWNDVIHNRITKTHIVYGVAKHGSRHYVEKVVDHVKD